MVELLVAYPVSWLHSSISLRTDLVQIVRYLL